MSGDVFGGGSVNGGGGSGDRGYCEHQNKYPPLLLGMINISVYIWISYSHIRSPLMTPQPLTSQQTLSQPQEFWCAADSGGIAGCKCWAIALVYYLIFASWWWCWWWWCLVVVSSCSGVVVCEEIFIYFSKTDTYCWHGVFCWCSIIVTCLMVVV